MLLLNSRTLPMVGRMKKKDEYIFFCEEVVPSLAAHLAPGSYACSLLSASLSYVQRTKSNTQVLNIWQVTQIIM